MKLFNSYAKKSFSLVVISAMQSEIDLLLSLYNVKRHHSFINKDFYEIEVNNKQLLCAVSGIGKVNAALTTQFIINTYKPKHILSLGVAGGIASGIAIGDVIVGQEIFQSDFDLSAFGYEIGQVPGQKLGFSSAIMKKSQKLNNHSSYVKYGNIVTADQFDTNSSRISKVSHQFNAFAKDMESAAIAQTCKINGIEFDVIRGISDLSRENAQSEFDNHFEKAVKTYTQVFLDNIDQLISR